MTVADLEKIMTKKKEVNVNNRALEFIYELVERNPNRFKANEFGDYQGEVWGKIDDECIYIIKSVFDREMGNSGYNSTAFLAWAKRNNATITDNGKRTKKARITGSATNCVCIRKNLTENEQTEMDEYDDLPL